MLKRFLRGKYSILLGIAAIVFIRLTDFSYTIQGIVILISLYLIKRGFWPKKSKRVTDLKEKDKAEDDYIKTGCWKV